MKRSSSERTSVEQPEEPRAVEAHESREPNRRESAAEWHARFEREHEEWNRKVEKAIAEMKEAAAELERAWGR